jgi:hypothetical protein
MTVHCSCKIAQCLALPLLLLLLDPGIMAANAGVGMLCCAEGCAAGSCSRCGSSTFICSAEHTAKVKQQASADAEYVHTWFCTDRACVVMLHAAFKASQWLNACCL